MSDYDEGYHVGFDAGQNSIINKELAPLRERLARYTRALVEIVLYCNETDDDPAGNIERIARKALEAP